MKILFEYDDIEKSRVLADDRGNFFVEYYDDSIDEWDMCGPYHNEFQAQDIAENYSLGYPI